MSKSNEFDIRLAVVKYLLEIGIERNNIRVEIPLDTASSNGRADIVILGNDLRCIELKSGKDIFNEKKLEEQILPYKRIFDFVGVAVDDTHKRIIEYDAGCGHIGKKDNWSKVTLTYTHETRLLQDWWGGKYNKLDGMFRYQNHALSAHDIVSILWASEIGDIIGKKTAGKWKHTKVWCEEKPIKEIRQLVVNALSKRPLNLWEKKFWKQFDLQLHIKEIT